MNGLVWFRSGNVRDSIIIQTVLVESDIRNFDGYQIEALVEVLMKRIKGESVSNNDQSSL